ncbi:uncharacterized protein LOC134274293 [Saccostrea cucullata]|uniref:uncharacterized protein LOC134274293 n=1 Tax=Saccostrea cuccullata TaxID=36930 RepID=UPI002ED2C944
MNWTGTIINVLWIIWEGIESVELPNNACRESLETIKSVSTCPSNTQEYVEAALRKNCTQRTQDCRSFEYHCVLNERMSGPVEVCAPSRFILSGKCTEFNVALQSIRKSYTADCTNFKNPCPASYNSTSSYLYFGSYNMIPTSATSRVETMTRTFINHTVTEDSEEPVDQRSEKAQEGVMKSDIIPISLITIFTVIAVGIGIFLRRLKQKQNGNIREVEKRRYSDIQDEDI